MTPPPTDPELRALLHGDEPAGPTHLQHWQVVSLLAALLGLGCLIGAGTVLSRSGLGAATVNRSCDGSLLIGLALLVAAGSLVGLARIAVDRRHVSETWFDGLRAAVMVPVPALCLLLAAPGFLGCHAAIRFAGWGAIGEALLGTPGMAVAGASAFGVGAALASCVRVRIPAEAVIAEFERIRAHGRDPLERSLRRAATYDPDALGADPADIDLDADELPPLIDPDDGH